MALTAAALVLAIPVFFDVGFIILVPIVYGFCKAAGVNPIKFGPPRGWASCWPRTLVVPPHPRIVGGAAIVKGGSGWITIIGLAICIPLAALAQVVAGWLNRKGSSPCCRPLPSSLQPWQQRKTARHPKAPQRAGRGHPHGAHPDPTGPRHGQAPPAPPCCPRAIACAMCCRLHRLPIFALMVAVGLAMLLLGRNQGWNRERTNAIMESARPPPPP